MATDNELISWAKLIEGVGGEVNLSTYVLFSKISEAAKGDDTVFTRLRELMVKHTNMGSTQVSEFMRKAEEYHQRYA